MERNWNEQNGIELAQPFSARPMAIGIFTVLFVCFWFPFHQFQSAGDTSSSFAGGKEEKDCNPHSNFNTKKLCQSTIRLRDNKGISIRKPSLRQKSL